MVRQGECMRNGKFIGAVVFIVLSVATYVLIAWVVEQRNGCNQRDDSCAEGCP
jgi:hypothetical protein